MKLYEISQKIEACIGEDGSVDTIQINELTLKFDEKAFACCAVIKNLAAEEAAIHLELKRLAQRAQTLKNNKDRLRQYTLLAMQRTGKKKISNGVHRLSVVKSPLALEILDETAVPAAFKYEFSETRIDKPAIIRHIKSTGEIPATGIGRAGTRHTS